MFASILILSYFVSWAGVLSKHIEHSKKHFKAYGTGFSSADLVGSRNSFEDFFNAVHQPEEFVAPHHPKLLIARQHQMPYQEQHQQQATNQDQQLPPTQDIEGKSEQIDRSDYDPQFIEKEDDHFIDEASSTVRPTGAAAGGYQAAAGGHQNSAAAPADIPSKVQSFSLPIASRHESLKDIFMRERMPKIQETLASGDQEAIAKLIAENQEDPFTVLPKQLKYYELLAADLYFSFLTKMVTWFVMISLILPALVPLFTFLSLGAEIAAIYLIPSID